MSRRLAILLPLAFVGMSVTSSSAQTSSVTMPDAQGAAFDPEAIGKGTPNDYDFLVGTWSFRFQQMGENGYRPVEDGIWTIRKIHDGLVIEDVWRKEETDNPTISYRIYDPVLERWNLQGFRPRTGTWDPGVSWSDGSHRFVVQTFGGQVLARIRYFDIGPDSFRWRADGSLDQGKTWILDLWKMEATRVQ
jgi:hypothetical protein